MPDGRFLSKTIAHDWELNRVSIEADYLFARCIPHLDVEGRMPGHPSQVKAIAVPLRDEMGPLDVDRALGELAESSLLRWYENDGRPWIEFPGFERHQKGLRRDRESDSPAPPSSHPESRPIRTVLGPTPDDSGPTPEHSRNVAASSPQRRGSNPAKLSQVKPSEVKASTSNASSDPNSGKMTESQKAMAEDLERHLAGVDPPSKRKKLDAQARMVLLGEDRKAWEDDTGEQVREEKRPELFRLALGYHADGTQTAFRSSVRYVVRLYCSSDGDDFDPSMSPADRKLVKSINDLRNLDLEASAI